MGDGGPRPRARARGGPKLVLAVVREGLTEGLAEVLAVEDALVREGLAEGRGGAGARGAGGARDRGGGGRMETRGRSGPRGEEGREAWRRGSGEAAVTRRGGDGEGRRPETAAAAARL